MSALTQAAEALQAAQDDLREWTPRYRFIDKALANIAVALAAIKTEAARQEKR